MRYDTLGRLVETIHPRVTGQIAVSRMEYDDVGNVVRATDEEGRTTVTRLDLEDRVLEIADAAGGRKVFEYDLVGNKTLESTVFDATTPRFDVLFEYDGANRLTRWIEPEGRVIDLVYDGVGNVLRQTLSDTTDPSFLSRVVESDYDQLNRAIRLRQLTESGSIEMRTKYDGEGNKVLEVDPLGRETARLFDELNRLVEILGPEWKPGHRRTVERRYDANGNLVTETLRNEVDGENVDQVRSFVYDNANRQVEQIDAEGARTTLEYDKASNLVRQINALMDATSFEYDERNRRTAATLHLKRVTEPNRSDTTRMAYDLVGNVLEEHLPNGNVRLHTYDELNRLTSTTDSLGPVASFEYDARGNRTTEIDANGNTSTNFYDGLDRLVRQDLPENRTLRFSYDVAGNRLAATDARGNTTTYDYDRLDRQVKVTDPAPFNFVATMAYDAAGNKISETDRRANTTTFEYDDLNRLVRMTDPAPFNYTMEFIYDAAGNLLSEIDRRGILSETRYDRENRPLLRRRDGLAIEENVYDAVGNRITLFDANGNRTDFDYDERQLMVAERRPLEAVTQLTLDEMGDPTVTVDPEGLTTTREYDVRRRLRFETNGENETTELGYDLNGNRTSMRHPKGNEWTFAYDGANRLVSVTDPATHTTSYAYDPNSNLTLQTDANDHSTGREYDELNRLKALVYPDEAREEYAYDANGNRTLLRDARGQETTSTFDELDRESERVYPGTGLRSLAYVYDANNNPLTITETFAGDQVFTTLQTWDNFDRLSSVTDRFGKTLSYGYDANGNRIRLTDPDGKVTLYGFDELNRLTTATLPEVGVTTYDWYKNGRLREVGYPNGVTASYTYDLANRTATIANRLGMAVVSSYAYTYDANGNRVEQSEENGGPPEATTYDFDVVDRLRQVAYPDKTSTYTYDPVGNRITDLEFDGAESTITDKEYSYDVRDRLTTVTDNLDASRSATYQFDANGNQTQKALANGAVTDFIYDARDQVVEVQNDGLLLESYSYDYQGLRVRKVGPGGLVRYTYDDQSVLLQTDDFGNTLAKYDYGPDRLLSLSHATDGRVYYLFDVLHSTTNLMAPDGAVKARRFWDAWGNVRHGYDETANPFEFTGHEMDEATGLIYMKARFYDPEIGRFLRMDPVEGDLSNPPSLHKYTYVFNNPTAFLDLTGREPVDPESLRFGPGIVEQQYQAAVQAVSDSSNSPAERALFGVLAVSVAPLTGIEQLGTGILNIPHRFTKHSAESGRQLAKAIETDDSLERTKASSRSVGEAAFAMAEGLAVFLPAANTAQSPTARSLERLGQRLSGKGRATGGGTAEASTAETSAVTREGSASPAGNQRSNAVLTEESAQAPGVEVTSRPAEPVAGPAEPRPVPEAGRRTATDRLTQHTSRRDLEGASKEVVTGVPQGGEHVQEVSEAARGLRRRIRQINGALENPNLSQAQRSQLTEELSQASKNLDAAEDALQGRFRQHDN